jgi:hypothetical protein
MAVSSFKHRVRPNKHDKCSNYRAYILPTRTRKHLSPASDRYPPPVDTAHHKQPDQRPHSPQNSQAPTLPDWEHSNYSQATHTP